MRIEIAIDSAVASVLPVMTGRVASKRLAPSAEMDGLGIRRWKCAKRRISASNS